MSEAYKVAGGKAGKVMSAVDFVFRDGEVGGSVGRMSWMGTLCLS